MVKNIAVIGLGYIGKIHLRLLSESSVWNLVGVYDLDKTITKDLALQYGVKAFQTLDEAIEQSEVLDILTPSHTHFEIAKQSVRNGKHFFIEKPLTHSLKEARELQNLISEAGVQCYVSNVERFNPAFISAKPFINNPVFIEIHRLAQYNQRGTDVSVVLDLMMHDLDLVLHIVKSNVRKFHVSGSSLMSGKLDIVNARLEFENGCVANITANRIAFKNTRKFRIFDADCFASINLLDKITEVVKIKNAPLQSTNLILDPGNGLPKKEIVFEHPIILPTNAINEELNTFHSNINSVKAAKTGIDEAISVLELALNIEERLKI